MSIFDSDECSDDFSCRIHNACKINELTTCYTYIETCKSSNTHTITKSIKHGDNYINEIIVPYDKTNTLYRIVKSMFLDFNELNPKEIHSITNIILCIKEKDSHETLFKYYDVSYDILKEENFTFKTNNDMSEQHINNNHYISVEIHTNDNICNKISLNVDYICFMNSTDIFRNCSCACQYMITKNTSSKYKLTTGYNELNIPFSGAIHTIIILCKDTCDDNKFELFGNIIFDFDDMRKLNKYTCGNTCSKYILKPSYRSCVNIHEISMYKADNNICGHYNVNESIKLELMSNYDVDIDILIKSYAVVTLEKNDELKEKAGEFNNTLAGILYGN